MSSVVPVAVHASQFPQNVRRDLLQSLQTRRVNHKFHYESVKQAQQWLALHREYSPSRRDPDCKRIYDRAFEAAAEVLSSRNIHLIGIGSGGGQKDTRLLELLGKRRKTAFYTPCDVSTAMVLTARASACESRRGKEPAVPPSRCFPIVCDIAKADDLAEALDEMAGPDIRILTFFGMIPNFEPRIILPRLAGLVRKQDLLLFSANLAPGPDYAQGVRRVLPQYENELTSEWLTTFLVDLGVGATDGDLRFSIATDKSLPGLKRIEACFHCRRIVRIGVEAREFVFRAGESIRLFFSYRYTPALVHAALHKHGLFVRKEWITRSGEEGVFLVGRTAGNEVSSKR
jgi:uncharacterized SAM-dependent methyltransferase